MNYKLGAYALIVIMLALALTITLLLTSSKHVINGRVDRDAQCHATASEAILKLRSWADTRLAIHDPCERGLEAGGAFDRVGNVLTACYGVDAKEHRAYFEAAVINGSQAHVDAVTHGLLFDLSNARAGRMPLTSIGGLQPTTSCVYRTRRVELP